MTWVAGVVPAQRLLDHDLHRARDRADPDARLGYDPAPGAATTTSGARRRAREMAAIGRTCKPSPARVPESTRKATMVRQPPCG